MKKVVITLSILLSFSLAKSQIQGTLIEQTGQDPGAPIYWYNLHITPSQTITDWEIVFLLESGASLKDIYNADVLDVTMNGTSVSFKPKANTWATNIHSGSQMTFGFSVQDGLIIDNLVQCFNPVPNYLAQNCLDDYVEEPVLPYNYDSLWVLNYETGNLFTSEKVTKNVGIGTTNPLERLQIGDEIVFHDGGTKLLGRNFHFNSESNCVRIVDGYSQMVAFDGIGNLDFRTATTSDLAETEQEWNQMRFNAQGNFGIGTAFPAFRLDVAGDVQVRGNSLRLGTNDGNDKGDNTAQRALVHGAGDELYINYEGDFEGGTIFNGKVGIGTTDIPENYMLAISGDIIARKVKVAIEGSDEWNDKVFEADYDLLTLEEIEQYTNKNKHLPGVPSAEDVVEHGIDIGEMQSVLLGKIEELTLHMISMKKENEALKLRLEKLEK